MTKIISLIGGLLRRLAILIALPVMGLLGLIYMGALFVIVVYDGHLSTEKRSKGKRWLDRMHRESVKMITKVVFLDK